MIRKGRRGVNQAGALLIALALGCSACSWKADGPFAADLEARLSLVDPAPEVGREFRVRLELTNRGKGNYLNDRQQVQFTRVLDVRSADGNGLPYLGWSWEFDRNGPLALKPGESVTLFEGFNVANEYEVSRTGVYSVQFIGGGLSLLKESDVSRFPPDDPDGRPLMALSRLRVVSNTLRVTVGPGDSLDKEALRTYLSPSLPELWSLGDQLSVSSEGRSSVMVVTRWNSLRDHVSVPLRFADFSPGPDSEQIGEFRGRKVWIDVRPDARDVIEELRPILRRALQ